MIEPSLLGPALGLGSVLALGVALISHRCRRDLRQGDHRAIMVGNYERWVRGLCDLIHTRERQLNEFRASLEGANDDAVSKTLEEFSNSQERLRALLQRQLRGDHRTRLDSESLHREVLAQDEMLRALLLRPSEADESDECTREAIDQIRRKMATVAREALEVESAVEHERFETEKKLADLVPARALEKALGLLEALEQDLQALERTVLDQEGQLRTGFSDEEIGAFEKRLRAIGEELAATTTDLHGASDDRGIHSIGHRLRLRRIERGMLRRFIEAHHLTHERDHLEREVNRLAMWKHDASEVIADFQRIEAANTDLRLELARTRERMQEARQRVAKLESVRQDVSSRETGPCGRATAAG